MDRYNNGDFKRSENWGGVEAVTVTIVTHDVPAYTIGRWCSGKSY